MSTEINIPSKKEMLYEGKAKKIFATEDKDLVIAHYKDDATAFDGIKKDVIESKGVVNNLSSSILFSWLEEKGINTHFVKQLSERDSLLKKVKIFPLEVIMRNVVAGSLVRKLGREEGKILNIPILEFCYKDDALHDPPINDSHILAFEWANEKQLAKIKELSYKTNELLKERFLKANLTLVDIKFEYGLFKNEEILLADEISPDTSRLWDIKSKEKLDKDRFRFDMGNVESSYQEVLRRLQSTI